MDRAQATDGFYRDVAVANEQARIAAALAPRDTSVDGLCIECDQPIEPERLALFRGATSRCAACALHREERMRADRCR